MNRLLVLVVGLVAFLSVIYAVHSSDLMYDLAKAPKHCLKGRKVYPSNYSPQGSEYEIGNLTVYESDHRSSRRLLIAIHDIFGMSNNAKQVVDELSELYNFRVILPDVFRGFPWPVDKYPPENEEEEQEFQQWLENNGSWYNIVKWDVYTIIDSFRARENITEVGIFGFCFGGKVSTLASTEIDEIMAAGLVHPSWVENSEANGVKNPMYLMPARDDPDMVPFHNVLVEKFGRSRTGHRRFDDMDHGFAAATGNFSDPVNKQRVDEVIDILGGFFDRMIPE